MMVKATIPVAAGNAAARNGFDAIARILKEQKPEAAYFIEENGRRTAVMFMEVHEAAQIPAIAEPWFLALNAAVEFHPAMRPEDLVQAGPAVARAVETYGQP
jgi:hypothetical protein